MSFTIQRGTNISHWLSQSDRRGAERAGFFTQEDVRLIAQLGFDHIRLPIDEVQMWDDQGRKDPEAFSLAALTTGSQMVAAAANDGVSRSHAPGSAGLTSRAAPPAGRRGGSPGARRVGA